VLGLLAGGAGLRAAERPPNIVVILADDYGYGSSGCYGVDGRLVQTPNIDRLAREGRRFTDANTTSSVCSPTRYSLVTGRYCWAPLSSTRCSARSLAAAHRDQPPDDGLAAEAPRLRHGRGGQVAPGYGAADDSPKWRTDYTAELSPGPLDVGFDYHFGVPSNHGDLTASSSRTATCTACAPARFRVHEAQHLRSRRGQLPGHLRPEDMENAKTKILDLDAPRRKNTASWPRSTDRALRWMSGSRRASPSSSTSRRSPCTTP
jgi:hypothetical protein